MDDSDISDEDEDVINAGESEGVEIFTLSDELGKGVYVSCKADTSPADLIEGLCNLLSQITRSALESPKVTRAGDLGLGDDLEF
jgi:hypothetical protein